MAHTPGFARLQKIMLTALRQQGLLSQLSSASAVDDAAAGDSASPSRRTVLRGVGVALAGATFPASLSGCSAEDSESDLLPVAIVGAGLAGTHCAWRLQEAGITARLFEAGPRVGGRTLTSRDGHPGGQLCELGGELIDSNHAAMICLVDELGLTLDDRTQLGAGVSTLDTWFVNGAIVPESSVVEQFVAVAPSFAAAAAAADSDDAIYELLDLTTLSDWLDANVPEATYPELHEILVAAYRGEFGREVDEQSALNMLYLIGSDDPDPFRIFGESDERWHVHQGNDAIATGMAERLAPDTLLLGYELTAVRALETGYELVFNTMVGEEVIRARRIVLAIPWTILRNVDLSESGLSSEKLGLIETLGYGANIKIMGWFTSPVWRDTYAVSGAFTRDDLAQQAWDSSIGQDGDEGLITAFLSGSLAQNLDTATALGFFEAVTVGQALEPMWPGCAQAFLADSVTPMLWPQAKYVRASYTCYEPGQWATWSTEGQPDGDAHFCGEHCSVDFQGWMEGAAETGALVAAAILSELGKAPSAGLECILEAKLVVEQPALRQRTQRPRWRSRRQALGHAAPKALARVLSR